MEDSTVSGTTWLRTDHTLIAPAGTSLEGPTSFGEDAAGNLYLTDDSLFGTPGEVFLLELAAQVCVAGDYDVNDDGRIDVLDVRGVAGDWQRPNFTASHDVDCSGAVDIVDVQLVAGALQNGG